MTRKIFVSSILSIMVLAAWTLALQETTHKQQIHGPTPPITQRIKSEQLDQIQTAVVEFTEQVKLLGAILKGNYMFLHDEGKMSRGEPCTWVYARGATGKFDKLVVSFHCIPESRDTIADRFSMIVSATPPNRLPELLEYRFAGSTVGHKVPSTD
ncbi:MAG TPA: hypothetical protein VFF31_16395 [Blastocatellia bacterium]|nr:hypothetical protein [Blastocatellia bacterium]